MFKFRAWLGVLLVSVMAFGQMSCGDDKEKDEPDNELSITKKNLEGSWRFVRAENNVNGVITAVEESEFEIDRFPLDNMALYNVSLSFVGDYLNGYLYELRGKEIEWELMTPEMRDGLSIVVVKLTSDRLIIHYEYRDAGTDRISGYTDIIYRRLQSA